MDKTRDQQKATDYVMEYLDRLLDMEDMVGHRIEQKLDEMVERKVRQVVSARTDIAPADPAQ